MPARPSIVWKSAPSRGLRVLATLTLAAWPVTETCAQESYTPAPAGLAIGANAIFQVFSGEDFESFHDGFGGTATIRYTAASGFQLLGGAQYSIHGIEGGPGDMRFLELFLDPRYVLELIDSERAMLLIGGRAAFVRQTLSGAALEGDSSGLLLGGTVGGIYGLRSRLALEFSLFFGGLWTGGVTAVVDAEKSGNGNVTTLNLGIVWSFPP